MDVKQLKQIAELSKLKIEDTKVESMLKDFNSIVEYVDKVKELDTTGVSEDEIYFNHENSIRPDVVGKSLSIDQISEIAPKFENGYIVVPRVIET
ncbi:MAG: Asp-tRNA(Asn)/Glu-tRNA(Gln) amidotransferase subunit GatC [Leptospiraceae bacterium]|nr:Asp-tRNA(Asn)/Glu-tRNA(Gln) amidotransferase subunit GatC [Leptospiraceae bacterium]MCP5497867.1 Asp-tRNA(Asn)/Glu-tRNA(Gln) amidotransferase subunit GatC [Leptospiraceae bacterium]